jgi:hypothetical protein
VEVVEAARRIPARWFDVVEAEAAGALAQNVCIAPMI